jgi:hypothetical protein
MKSFTSRLTVVGLLALTLVAGAANAAPPPSNHERASPRAESANFVVAVQEWLLSLVKIHPVPSRARKPSIQPKGGPALDPNGGQH